MYEGEKYKGDRTVKALQEFVLSKLKVDIKEIYSENWGGLNKQQWLLFLCGDSNVNCPEKETMIKLAASLVIYCSMFYLVNVKFIIFLGRISTCRNCKGYRTV